MISPPAAGRINRLSPLVIDQIAAGEVVERPASVVKELVDNSLDAGATRIDVELEEGGLSRISVRDNGRGIHPDDLLLAVTRHATSKLLDASELVDIRTLGFRGEALASIAAVARVDLRTRQAEAAVGTHLHAIPGEAPTLAPAGMPVGTQVEVHALFANVPARRKFMRAEATEVGQVSETLLRLAVVHPEVHFTLRHGKRELLSLPRTSLAGRVAQVLERRVSGPFFAFAAEEDGIQVHAFLPHPSAAGRGRGSPYFIVRRRVVRERSLGQILVQAYGLAGEAPTACLLVEPPAGAVDVNVHPQKAEVRFSEPQQVYAAVRRALAAAIAAAPWAAEVMGAAARSVGTGPEGQGESDRPPRAAAGGPAPWGAAAPVGFVAGPERGPEQAVAAAAAQRRAEAQAWLARAEAGVLAGEGGLSETTERAGRRAGGEELSSGTERAGRRAGGEELSSGTERAGRRAADGGGTGPVSARGEEAVGRRGAQGGRAAAARGDERGAAEARGAEGAGGRAEPRGSDVAEGRTTRDAAGGAESRGQGRADEVGSASAGSEDQAGGEGARGLDGEDGASTEERAAGARPRGLELHGGARGSADGVADPRAVRARAIEAALAGEGASDGELSQETGAPAWDLDLGGETGDAPAAAGAWLDRADALTPGGRVEPPRDAEAAGWAARAGADETWGPWPEDPGDSPLLRWSERQPAVPEDTAERQGPSGPVPEGRSAGGYRLSTRALGPDYDRHKRSVMDAAAALRPADAAPRPEAPEGPTPRPAPSRLDARAPGLFAPEELRVPPPPDPEDMSEEPGPCAPPRPDAPRGEAPALLACLPGPVALFGERDALLAVDLRRLRSHLVYLRLQRDLIGRRAVAVQGLLTPAVVRRPPEDVALLAAARGELLALGVDLDAFGDDAVVVRGVPAHLRHCVDDADAADLVARLVPWLRIRANDGDRGARERGLLDAIAATRGGDPAPRLARRWLAELLETGASLESVPGIRRWSATALLGGA